MLAVMRACVVSASPISKCEDDLHCCMAQQLVLHVLHAHTHTHTHTSMKNCKSGHRRDAMLLCRAMRANERPNKQDVAGKAAQGGKGN